MASSTKKLNSGKAARPNPCNRLVASVRHNCNGRMHSVGLTVRGQLVFDGHDRDDLRRQLKLTEMGNGNCPCATILYRWRAGQAAGVPKPLALARPFFSRSGRDIDRFASAVGHRGWRRKRRPVPKAEVPLPRSEDGEVTMKTLVVVAHAIVTGLTSRGWTAYAETSSDGISVYRRSHGGEGAGTTRVAKLLDLVLRNAGVSGQYVRVERVVTGSMNSNENVVHTVTAADAAAWDPLPAVLWAEHELIASAVLDACHRGIETQQRVISAEVNALDHESPGGYGHPGRHSIRARVDSHQGATAVVEITVRGLTVQAARLLTRLTCELLEPDGQPDLLVRLAAQVGASRTRGLAECNRRRLTHAVVRTPPPPAAPAGFLDDKKKGSS